MFNLYNDSWFAILRAAEDGGGGAAAAGSEGTSGSGGDGAGVAGSDDASPPATFLTKSLEGTAATGDDTAAGGAEGDAKADEAPVEFDATKLTLAEGIEIPEEAQKVFTDLLNNKELSAQERGQQLVDLHTKAIQDAVTSFSGQQAKERLETWETMNADWRKQVAELPEFKADPDGEAGKILQACLAVGAGDEFVKALNLTGAGNNPAILQVLHKLAQPFIEGKAVGGEAKTASQRRLGDNMYTSTNKG